MSNLKLTLVEDWREFSKWSSTRWQLLLAGVVVAMGHLPDLVQHLPVVLQWLNDNWSTLLPFLQKIFPNATQANWIAVANLVTVLLRITKVVRNQSAPSP